MERTQRYHSNDPQQQQQPRDEDKEPKGEDEVMKSAADDGEIRAVSEQQLTTASDTAVTPADEDANCKPVPPLPQPAAAAAAASGGSDASGAVGDAGGSDEVSLVDGVECKFNINSYRMIFVVNTESFLYRRHSLTTARLVPTPPPLLSLSLSLSLSASVCLPP